MRPPRIAILVFFIAASLFLLTRALTSAGRSAVSRYPARPQAQKSVWGYMYYNTPFSLFPPNAAISLTDDNSTSFAARPAAFGPKLAQRGLSGQLWVGSGFTEDAAEGDGELGCSDLPGWDGDSASAPLKSVFKAAPRIPISVATAAYPKRGDKLLENNKRDAVAQAKSKSSVNDGTDNYLHGGVDGKASVSVPHADIQTIQEAAEIEGKIVLLKRGGCGFLEKIMWAQRRGAVAVVVGDNQKGGPLIQMFAHGEEVENVTIPSVFTARTTAHLLSSLTQPGSFIEDTLDDNGNAVLKVQQSHKNGKKNKQGKAPRRTAASLRTAAASPERASVSTSSGGWVSRVFRWHGPPHQRDEVSRSTTDQDDWVVVEDWRDAKDAVSDDSTGKKAPGSKTDDEITQKAPSNSKNSGIKAYGKPSPRPNGATGGYRTPGSRPEKNDEASDKGHGLMSKFFGDEDSKPKVDTLNEDDQDDDYLDNPDVPETHEGLWVTITPTSSASPFFDTLLVLVISPLITLTVVYALLIVRAKIRRRRWRAPKSVVERLPVRTYHTVASSPNLSPRLPSVPSSASPTTPLLQQSSSIPRPRSRTTTGVLESENFLTPSSALPTPRAVSRSGPRGEHEKGAGGFSAEWKKYMGRQVECVVCLEEYVDGVSRVMSLPCGHEFHADCITPWLTTRRRTCPICKGDVVRSLGTRGSSSTPRYEPYRDDSDEEPDAESSGSRSFDPELDLEQGGSSRTREGRRSNQQEGWLGLLSGSFGARPRSPSPTPDDRDR